MSEAPVSLVLTGIPWRTAWKYTDRGYRHLFWDAGMILANVLALASAANLGTRVVVGFVDDDIERLLGLDPRLEFPLCVVAVGSGTPTAPGPPVSPRMSGVASGMDAEAARAFPAIGEVNDSGRLRSVEEVARWRTGRPRAPEAGAGLEVATPEPRRPVPDRLDRVIRRRGSARGFARSAMPADVLASVLGRSAAPLPTDHAPAGSSLTEVFLVAGGVDGLRPGSYRFDAGQFHLLQPGDFRREAGYLCLEQRLGADAAATHFLMSPLGAVLEAFGNRGYRVAQLEAGIVAGRIYLASYAYGYGATGLTFYDDEVAAFFAPHSSGRACMLVTCVGESLGRRDLRPLR